MQFELICKQEKKSYIDKKNVKHEYVETRFFLHNDQIENDLEITPYYREVKDDKGNTTKIITNADTIKTLAKKVKIGF